MKTNDLIVSKSLIDVLMDDPSFNYWKGRELFFSKTLPFIVDLLKRSHEILGPNSYAQYYKHDSQIQSTIILNDGALPLLRTLNSLPELTRPKTAIVRLTKLECACILANSFFSTFPRISDTRNSHVEMPSINMDSLLVNPKPSGAAKLLMIIHYFERLAERGLEEISKQGYVTFIRKQVNPNEVLDSLVKGCASVCENFEVNSDGSIEDCENALHADFANAYIGGM